MSKKIIIAIDGYSGTGKSTTAKMVADKLGYTYIDSGAMYRAITYYLLSKSIEFDDIGLVKNALDSCDLKFSNNQMWLNGSLIDQEIRSMEVNQNVSEVSAIPLVRRKLVDLQQTMSRDKGVVMDGRDIGTIVFPHAELKVFMIAEMEVRVERRKKQLASKGIIEYKEVIKENLSKRDEIDTSRVDSPLKKADDAVLIDTSHITLNEQVEQIVNLAKELIYEN